MHSPRSPLNLRQLLGLTLAASLVCDGIIMGDSTVNSHGILASGDDTPHMR